MLGFDFGALARFGALFCLVFVLCFVCFPVLFGFGLVGCFWVVYSAVFVVFGLLFGVVANCGYCVSRGVGIIHKVVFLGVSFAFGVDVC